MGNRRSSQLRPGRDDVALREERADSRVRDADGNNSDAQIPRAIPVDSSYADVIITGKHREQEPPGEKDRAVSDLRENAVLGGRTVAKELTGGPILKWTVNEAGHVTGKWTMSDMSHHALQDRKQGI